MFIIVLLFLNQIVIYANEEHNEKEYVIDELGDYLGGFDYDSQSEVMLSQKYAINGSKNKSNIYFVKVNDDMIGAVTVSDYKGEKISAFLFGKEAFEDLSAG